MQAIFASCALVLILAGIFGSILWSTHQGDLARAPRKSKFNSDGLTKVSGRVFYIGLNRTDPLIVSRLLIAPDDAPILNLRCEDRFQIPLRLHQRVECKFDSDKSLQSLSIAKQDQSDGPAAAIETLDEFMSLIQEKKWSEATRFVDTLANPESMSERVFQTYWKKGLPRARSNNPYVRKNYNGYGPERYRILEADDEGVVVLVNNSELFRNVDRLDRFFLNSRGPDWRVGRIQTDFEEPLRES